jgi:hypothetical protein
MYNYATAFEPTVETPHYCPECLKAIAVAALIQYQQDTNSPEGEGVQVKLHTLHKTAEVTGDEIRIYTWKELGFTV